MPGYQGNSNYRDVKMMGTIVGIVGTLLGVMLGFVLNEVYVRGGKKDRSGSRLRTLTKLELMQNLHLLEKFWGKFQADTSEERRTIIGEDIHDTYEILAYRCANKFIDIEVPQWNRKIWESQFSAISSVLSEDEIIRVWSLYDDMDKISAYHEMLASYKAELDKEILEAASREKDPVFFSVITAFAKESKFQDEVLDLWSDCEQTINNLLKKGNPIL